jgi:hypothetical protein
MKLAGFLLLLSGGIITLTAVVILPASAARGMFTLAGLVIEAAGLVLIFRSHMPAKQERG